MKEKRESEKEIARGKNCTERKGTKRGGLGQRSQKNEGKVVLPSGKEDTQRVQKGEDQD